MFLGLYEKLHRRRNHENRNPNRPRIPPKNALRVANIWFISMVYTNLTNPLTSLEPNSNVLKSLQKNFTGGATPNLREAGSQDLGGL
jgi:hypothetical protein